mgnify:CR=1 FL=1
MTPEEKYVYDALKECIDKYGYTPTIRELCSKTGKKSPATIHYFLTQLEKKRYIERINNRKIILKGE